MKYGLQDQEVELGVPVEMVTCKIRINMDDRGIIIYGSFSPCNTQLHGKFGEKVLSRLEVVFYG